MKRSLVALGFLSMIAAACSSSAPAPVAAPTTPAVHASVAAPPSPSTLPTPVATSAAPSPSFLPVSIPKDCHPKVPSLHLSSTEELFSTDCLAARSGAPIVITYHNKGGFGDPIHNLSIARDPGGLSSVFRGAVVHSNHAITYHVPGLAAGVYHFQCDLHPDTMTGVLIVK